MELRRLIADKHVIALALAITGEPRRNRVFMPIMLPEEPAAGEWIMRLKTLVLIAIASLYGFSASAQGWFLFEETEELFSVNLPHQPMVEEIVYHSEFHAELPAKVYSASDGQVEYTITVVNYAPTQIEGVRAVYDLRGSIAYAAWNIRKRGGDLTYDAYAQIDRIDGHHLQITNPDQSRTFVAIHLHDSRLYILEIYSRPSPRRERRHRRSFNNRSASSMKMAFPSAMIWTSEPGLNNRAECLDAWRATNDACP